MNTATTQEQKLLMVGLPSTGKTTYLGAFWNAIEKSKNAHSVKLADVLPDDRIYLNSLRDDWLRYEVLGRTQDDETRHPPLSVIFGDGKVVSLSFPDISGETFRDIVESRHWPVEFGDVIEGVTELMMFIHPDYVKDSPTHLEFAKLTGKLPENLSTGKSATRKKTQEFEEWTAKIISTQMKNIEILQLLTSNRANTNVRKIGIVISAWDRVVSMEMSPPEYLEKEMPMLSQFLEANSDIWECRIFGVSAQGGDYGEKDDLDRMTNFTDPLARPIIAGLNKGEAEPNDITYPVSWLFS